MTGIMSGNRNDLDESQIRSKILGEVLKKGVFKTQSRHFKLH